MIIYRFLLVGFTTVEELSRQHALRVLIRSTASVARERRPVALARRVLNKPLNLSLQSLRVGRRQRHRIRLGHSAQINENVPHRLRDSRWHRRQLLLSLRNLRGQLVRLQLRKPLRGVSVSLSLFLVLTA